MSVDSLFSIAENWKAFSSRISLTARSRSGVGMGILF